MLRNIFSLNCYEEIFENKKVHNHCVNHDFASSVKDNDLNELRGQYQELIDYKEPDIVKNIESVNREAESSFQHNNINIDEMMAILDPTLAQDIKDLNPSQRSFLMNLKNELI